MERGHGNKYDLLWQEAVVALFTEKTIEAAAEKVGVHYQTLRNWMKEQEFIEELRRLQEEAVENAYRMAASEAVNSVEALTKVRDDKEAPATSRVSAAKALLDLANSKQTYDEMVARLEALESGE